MLGLRSAFWQELQEDLKQVEGELEKALADIPHSLFREAALYLHQSGGKRVRPALAVISARCCASPVERVLPLAVALELFHMATLVHDDIIDASILRRGRSTVWVKWGKQFSLYLGNYLFSYAMSFLNHYEDKRINRILVYTSARIAQGELEQLARAFDITITQRDYFRHILFKTALLLASSCQLGALVAGASEEMSRLFYRYGRDLGLAFQITDDVLDMMADGRKLGKPIGSDIRQGVITLPAIYALNHSSDRDRLAFLLSKRDKGEEEIKETLELIRKSGGIEYALAVAGGYLEKACLTAQALPPTPARELLLELARRIKQREK